MRLIGDSQWIDSLWTRVQTAGSKLRNAPREVIRARGRREKGDLVMKSLLRITVALLVLCLPVIAQEFRFVSFDVRGCDLTGPNGVNAHGRIVGRCVDTNGVHGFLFDLNTGHSELID